MARLPLVNENDPAVPPEVRETLNRIKQESGRLLNVRRAIANHPPAFEAFNAMLKAVYRGNSSLTPAQAELAYTTATVVNNCYY